MEHFFMLLGFALASYAVVGNDAIQTLGTFLSSNSKRPWWVLWLFSSTILVSVMMYGFFVLGDISYGKFDGTFIKEGKDIYPAVFYWWYIIPPLILLVITRFGIPVSTTFLIVSVFAPSAIDKMILKSVVGYGFAFVLAIVVYLLISKLVEKYFIETHTGDEPHWGWVVAQWLATGFLWSQWLLQDLINIFVYLYIPLKESPETAVYYIVGSTVLLVFFQGVLFYYKGGEIQKIVTTKTNTTDIRSATIIDFIYAIVLLFFYGPIPMSTTWVFVGLLAGREFAINFQLKTQSMSATSRVVFWDFAKIILGLVVSILLVVMISFLRG